MDGDIRQVLSAIEELGRSAWSAGQAAHGEALGEYVAQFHGRRPSFEERCAADAMSGAVDAFEAWAFRAGVSEDDWTAAERAFLAGWQHAADAV